MAEEAIQKLFIGNIPEGTTGTAIEEFFRKQNINVKKVDTVKNFAFAFVVGQKSADDSMKLAGKDFNGRPIVIQVSKNKMNLPEGENKCFECGGKGHWARDCKLRISGPDGQKISEANKKTNSTTFSRDIVIGETIKEEPKPAVKRQIQPASGANRFPGQTIATMTPSSDGGTPRYNVTASFVAQHSNGADTGKVANQNAATAARPVVAEYVEAPGVGYVERDAYKPNMFPPAAVSGMELLRPAQAGGVRSFVEEAPVVPHQALLRSDIQPSAMMSQYGQPSADVQTARNDFFAREQPTNPPSVVRDRSPRRVPSPRPQAVADAAVDPFTAERERLAYGRVISKPVTESQPASPQPAVRVEPRLVDRYASNIAVHNRFALLTQDSPVKPKPPAMVIKQEEVENGGRQIPMQVDGTAQESVTAPPPQRREYTREGLLSLIAEKVKAVEKEDIKVEETASRDQEAANRDAYVVTPSMDAARDSHRDIIPAARDSRSSVERGGEYRRDARTDEREVARELIRREYGDDLSRGGEPRARSESRDRSARVDARDVDAAARRLPARNDPREEVARTADRTVSRSLERDLRRSAPSDPRELERAAAGREDSRRSVSVSRSEASDRGDPRNQPVGSTRRDPRDFERADMRDNARYQQGNVPPRSGDTKDVVGFPDQRRYQTEPVRRTPPRDDPRYQDRSAIRDDSTRTRQASLSRSDARDLPTYSVERSRDDPRIPRDDSRLPRDDPRMRAPVRGDPRDERMRAADPRNDPRFEPRADPRIDPRADPRSDSRADPRADPRSDSRADPRSNPRADPRSNPRADPRSNPIVDPKYDRSHPPEIRGGRNDDRGLINGVATRAPERGDHQDKMRQLEHSSGPVQPDYRLQPATDYRENPRAARSASRDRPQPNINEHRENQPIRNADNHGGPGSDAARSNIDLRNSDNRGNAPQSQRGSSADRRGAIAASAVSPASDPRLNNARLQVDARMAARRDEVARREALLRREEAQRGDYRELPARGPEPTREAPKDPRGGGAVQDPRMTTRESSMERRARRGNSRSVDIDARPGPTKSAEEVSRRGSTNDIKEEAGGQARPPRHPDVVTGRPPLPPTTKKSSYRSRSPHNNNNHHSNNTRGGNQSARKNTKEQQKPAEEASTNGEPVKDDNTKLSSGVWADDDGATVDYNAKLNFDPSPEKPVSSSVEIANGNSSIGASTNSKVKITSWADDNDTEVDYNAQLNFDGSPRGQPRASKKQSPQAQQQSKDWAEDDSEVDYNAQLNFDDTTPKSGVKSRCKSWANGGDGGEMDYNETLNFD